MTLPLKTKAEQFSCLINRLIPVNQQEVIFDLINYKPSQLSLSDAIFKYLKDNESNQNYKKLTDLIIEILYQNAPKTIKQ